MTSIPETLLALALLLQNGDVMTPRHVAKIRSVTSAEIAPDGSLVAYALSLPRAPWTDKNGTPYTELRVVDREGRTRGFVTGEVNVSQVRFAPDGRSITYLAKRGDDKHNALWRIAVDGGESQKVYAHETSIAGYAFSPDGRTLAFLAAEKEPEARKKSKEKGFDAEVYEEQLLFTRIHVLALPAEGEEGTEPGKPRVLEVTGHASELSFSPAGDALAVALAPTPLVDDEYMAKKVHVIDVASGAVRARFDNPGKLGEIRISPDGKHVAMISGETINDPAEGRLMVAPAGGGALRDLLPGLEGHVTAVAWKDHDTIAFVADIGVTSSYETIDVDGSNRVTLIPAGKHAITGLSLAANGGYAAMTIESWKHPREVFVCADLDPKPVRLTDHNEWLNELRFAKQEVVRYTARDGLEIEGILVRPLDEEKDTRYPLIVTVHGGPEAHVKDGFATAYSNPGQMAAARGMAVFYPNYRGSTGRGVAFSRLGQGDFGGKEFDDLVDAVDHFVRVGLVDEKRVGITGGSYGGYATAWCSTKYTERFAAGVMFVGISDQISKAGTTDIPNEMFLVHENKRPWEDWQHFLDRSPIRWVEQARTPLLIMHGKDDPRVHPSQSLELYRNLKVIGKTPVRLVWYPGEGHGNRKAASRYDYSVRMLMWFEHYLKGDGQGMPPADLEYGFESGS
jgi:dipeptidyl aminopeptidase/acylaminoacyl peptidase